MNTIVKNFLLILSIALIWLLPSCKKNNPVPYSNPALKNLLVGSPTKVWQIAGGDPSVIWTESKDGLQQHSGAGTPYVFSDTDCIKNNDYFALYADGTYAQSTYSCNMFATSTQLFKEDGGTGQWGLAANNTMTFGNTGSCKLVSVSATDLYIGTYTGTYHFKSVDKLPFLTSTQQLTGTGSKTWKISKFSVGGVGKALTTMQAATWFTYTSTGIFTNTFTGSTYGQPVSGTWSYDEAENQYIYTLSAINQTCTVQELTANSFIYNYIDGTGNYLTYYLIPQ